MTQLKKNCTLQKKTCILVTFFWINRKMWPGLSGNFVRHFVGILDPLKNKTFCVYTNLEVAVLRLQTYFLGYVCVT